MSTSEGLQHCLPLEVNAAWVPQVFLRIARQGGHAPPQALDLDHASIVYAAPGEQLVPNNPDLLLLEVVRKAFARRRTDIGDEFLQQVIDGKFRNSMLGLIGSHLHGRPQGLARLPALRATVMSAGWTCPFAMSKTRRPPARRMCSISSRSFSQTGACRTGFGV